MKVASAFDPGNGILDQLRELAEAEPFVPFTIRLQTGTKLRVAKRQHIEFTHYGSPKIWSATTGKHSLDEPGEPKRWRILNVDASGDHPLSNITNIATRKAAWRTAQARLPFTDKAQILAKLRDKPVTMQDTFCVIDELKAAGVINRYAIAGAVGAMFYTEAFRTLDIDFLISLAAAENARFTSFAPIFAWLALRGYTEFDTGGHILIEGWPVKFLPVSDLLSKEALETAHQLPFDELLVPVVQAEYLAAEALKLSRPKDVGRVDSLRRSNGFDEALFEQLIERFGLHEQWQNFESFLKP